MILIYIRGNFVYHNWVSWEHENTLVNKRENYSFCTLKSFVEKFETKQSKFNKNTLWEDYEVKELGRYQFKLDLLEWIESYLGAKDNVEDNLLNLLWDKEIVARRFHSRGGVESPRHPDSKSSTENSQLSI